MIHPKFSNRLQFIDFTLGLVMILMAWDHVTLFWTKIHGGLEGIYPFRNPELDIVLFISRFVNHWCASTFVFLSGLSLALSVNKRLEKGDTQREVSLLMIKRGLLLLLFEVTLVSPETSRNIQGFDGKAAQKHTKRP